MIAGALNFKRQPIVSLTLRGAGGETREFSFLMDTGHNGFLTLPPSDVTALNLEPQEAAIIRLADGSRVPVPVYAVTVLWEGAERTVSVVATGNQPLLGLALLTGYNLSLDVVDGGPVRITPLAAGAAS